MQRSTASETLLTRLRSALGELSLCPAHNEERPTLLVGVSGGMDSMVLLHALAALAPACGLDLHVVHVDHGLRPEAPDDAAFVRKTAVALGLPFHLTTLDPAALNHHPDGIEAAARRARYRAFFRAASNVRRAGQVPVVAVAHHADDQAETVLLHLTHGAGLRGLSGMRTDTVLPFAAVADDGGTDAELRAIRIVRPLLSLPRATLSAYARAQSLTWREDSTNADPTRTRNYMRRVILPALAEVNPQVMAALNRTADVIAGDWARLEAMDRRALEAAMVEPRRLDDIMLTSPPARVVLNLHTFKTYDRATQRGVLRVALTLLAPSHQHNLEFGQTERVLENLSGESSTGPHPIAAGLAWSVMGEWRDRRPPYLSLHRADTLPFGLVQPLLSGERTTHRLPAAGVVEPLPGWQLECRPVRRQSVPADWHSTSAWECWLDADKIGALLLTVPQPGMVMAPSGMDGHTKRVVDLLGDAKIHQSLRAHWPIVVDERTQRVLWVCGLRTAVDAAVEGATVNVRHLRWQQRNPSS